MKRFLFTAILALSTPVVVAAPTAGPIRAEIDTLLAALANSGCQFDRNGSWHTGAEAKDHILRKLDYIERRSTLQSTEQFIELAAAKSSSSGKPYHVKCGSAAPMESRQWLTHQLLLLRSAAAKGKP
jgi:hypothetical protein